jgi:hypothetical protein
MSPKKKWIAWVSAVVTPPGAVLVWHIAEKLHTLQWFLHLGENQYVRAVWNSLHGPSGQTVLLLCIAAIGALIFRELRARRKKSSTVVTSPKTDAIVAAAATVVETRPATPAAQGRTKVKRLTRKRQITITDSIELVEEEQPVETNV